MATNNSNIHVGPNTQGTSNPLIQTVQAVQHGSLPHNAQLDQTLVQTSQALEEAKYESALSAKGQILVEDAKQLLDSASRMLYEKNQDEKLQRLVGTGANAARETRGVTGGSVPLGRGDLQDLSGPARGIWDNGRSIATFAIRSGQFRQILVEILDLFQGVISKTKGNLASQSGQTSATEFAEDMNQQPLVTEEKKQELFEKFKALLIQLGSRPEYYTALDHVFHLFDQINQKADRLQGSGAVPSAADLPTQRYDQLWQEAKVVLEEFSGVGTFDELERRIWTLSQMMRADPQAQNFLIEFRRYLLEVTKNPQLLNNQQVVQTGRALVDEAQYLFRGKYRPQFNGIFDQTRMIMYNIQNDSSRQDFSSKLAKFGADFAFDEQGRPDLFVIQESLGQMRSIIVPVITKQLQNVPIPRVEGSNPKYDFAIDGMTLHVGDLLPEFVNFKTKTDSRVSVQKLAAQKNSTKIVMEVDQIRALFKDIRFNYTRKKFPKLHDNGVADVDLSQGTGVSIKIVWKLKSRLNQPYLLRLLKVKCSIDRLAITVHQAKHNIIDKLATKLFAGAIKKQVANSIVNNIINTLQPLSVKLNDLFKRKPITGVVGKANEQMKSALFTGQSGDQSLISKAKDAISQGVDSMRGDQSQGLNQGTVVTPVIVETVPLYDSVPKYLPITTPTTFVEKDRSADYVQSKPWAFEWYNGSSADVVEDINTEFVPRG